MLSDKLPTSPLYLHNWPELRQRTDGWSVCFPVFIHRWIIRRAAVLCPSSSVSSINRATICMGLYVSSKFNLRRCGLKTLVGFPDLCNISKCNLLMCCSCLQKIQKYISHELPYHSYIPKPFYYGFSHSDAFLLFTVLGSCFNISFY